LPQPGAGKAGGQFRTDNFQEKSLVMRYVCGQAWKLSQSLQARTSPGDHNAMTAGQVYRQVQVQAG